MSHMKQLTPDGFSHAEVLWQLIRFLFSALLLGSLLCAVLSALVWPFIDPALHISVESVVVVFVGFLAIAVPVLLLFILVVLPAVFVIFYKPNSEGWGLTIASANIQAELHAVINAVASHFSPGRWIKLPGMERYVYTYSPQKLRKGWLPRPYIIVEEAPDNELTLKCVLVPQIRRMFFYSEVYKKPIESGPDHPCLKAVLAVIECHKSD